MISTPESYSRHVVIVGGGISGIAAFIEIISSGKAQNITIVDSRDYGGGSGFATTDDRLLCNTSAETMSIVYGHRHDFVTYLHGIGIPATPNAFVSRRLFFEYVRHRYNEFCRIAEQKGICIRWITATVSTVEVKEAGDYHVVLDMNNFITATDVLICTGPGEQYIPGEVCSHLAQQHNLLDPFSRDSRLTSLPPQSRILILGSRLSAIDAAHMICGEGHTALLASPSGQLPAVRTGTPLGEESQIDFDTLRGIDPASPKFRQRLLRKLNAVAFTHSRRLLSSQIARSRDPMLRLSEEVCLAKDGVTDWQHSLAQLLEVGNRSLLTINPSDRELIIKHIAPIVGRYLFAFPLQSAESLLLYARTNRLAIRADRLREAEAREDGLYVSFYSGHAERFHAVVSATGYKKKGDPDQRQQGIS